MEKIQLPTNWTYNRKAIYYRIPTQDQAQFNGKQWLRLGNDLPSAVEAFFKICSNPMERERSKNTNVWLTYWIGDHVLNPKRIRPATKRQHLSSIQRLRGVFGDLDVPDITSSKITRWFFQRFDENKTGGRRELETLSSFLTWCKRYDLILYNTAMGLRLPRPQPRIHYVDDFEVEMFMETANPMIQRYIPLKIYTGARKNDLLSIKVSHITEQGLYIGDRKSYRVQTESRSRGRIFQIGTELETILNAFPMDGEYLFESSKRLPYIDFSNDTTSGFDSIWRRSKERALENGMYQSNQKDKPRYVDFEEAKILGIPLIFQERDLRAKTATDCENLSEASIRLGHTNLATTLRTYRRKPEYIKAKEDSTTRNL